MEGTGGGRTVWTGSDNIDFIATKRSSDKVAISVDETFTEHEEKIIEYLKEKKEISNSGAREVTGLSAAGVRKVLKKMVEREILSETGKNRNRKYLLKKN